MSPWTIPSTVASTTFTSGGSPPNARSATAPIPVKRIRRPQRPGSRAPAPPALATVPPARTSFSVTIETDHAHVPVTCRTPAFAHVTGRTRTVTAPWDSRDDRYIDRL
ncbi:hypothetical protein GCM10009527_078960 [Actinomadura nitritigenes]